MGFRYFEKATHADVYNKFRPSPPEQLIEKIVNFIKEQLPGPLNEAVDVGCGSGQSTEVLAPHFKKVTGIDPSETQIAEAQQRNSIPNVYYKIGSAEKLDIPDKTIHLITASQACHWFDLPKFYSEAERILVPGGVLAMYGNLLPRPQYENNSEELCKIVDKYFHSVLGKYVLPQSRSAYVDNYRTKDFNEVPFAAGPVKRDDSVFTERIATVGDLVGYIHSMSGFQKLLMEEGDEKSLSVLQEFENEIIAATEPNKKPHEIQIKIVYKYFLLLARKAL